MTLQESIDALLERCSAEEVTTAFARLALENYRSRGLRIASSGLTAEEKAAGLERNREQLRDDLDAIVNPPDLDQLDVPEPPAQWNREDFKPGEDYR